MDEDLDNSRDTADLPSEDVNILQASVPYADVVKEGESRSQLLNRITFYLTTLRPATFKSLRARGSGESRLVIATFKNASADDFDSFLHTEHLTLIPKEGSPAPIFHSFDSRALLADERSRSVIITDIPLYFKAPDVRTALSKFGTVQRFSIRTPPLSKFQKATCVFTDAAVANRWHKVWILWCKCHCFRVHPATLTKEETDARLQFTAVLGNLPLNYDAMDLARIYSAVGAVSLGIPRHNNSYKPKAWAYFSFLSQEMKDAAMEQSFSLKNRALFWIEPTAVNKLCARCGSNQHSTKDCDHFNNSRGRSTVPKSLARNYERFKPEGYKPHAPSSRQSASSASPSRNQFRSPSRSPSRSAAR